MAKKLSGQSALDYLKEHGPLPAEEWKQLCHHKTISAHVRKRSFVRKREPDGSEYFYVGGDDSTQVEIDPSVGGVHHHYYPEAPEVAAIRERGQTDRFRLKNEFLENVIQIGAQVMLAALPVVVGALIEGNRK